MMARAFFWFVVLVHGSGSGRVVQRIDGPFITVAECQSSPSMSVEGALCLDLSLGSI